MESEPGVVAGGWEGVADNGGDFYSYLESFELERKEGPVVSLPVEYLYIYTFRWGHVSNIRVLFLYFDTSGTHTYLFERKCTFFAFLGRF